jgi:hypothetical protein
VVVAEIHMKGIGRAHAAPAAGYEYQSRNLACLLQLREKE